MFEIKQWPGSGLPKRKNSVYFAQFYSEKETTRITEF
jgi:hypothetical protein